MYENYLTMTAAQKTASPVAKTLMSCGATRDEIVVITATQAVAVDIAINPDVWVRLEALTRTGELTIATINDVVVFTVPEA